MAIAFNDATSNTSAGTSVDITHTAAGDNRAAMVGLADFAASAPDPACTYDGVAMTEEARVTNGSVEQSALFSLAGPNTTASATVALTNAGNEDGGIVAGCITLTGVAQADPTRAAASASALTVDVSTLADDWALDAASSFQTAITAHASQTGRWNAAVSNVDGAGSTETATGATTTMSWSGGAVPSMCAASFIPAAEVTGTTSNVRVS